MAFERYFQARIRGTLHGSETINVLNFGSDEDAADNDALVQVMIALATAIIECAIQQLIPAVTSDWTLEAVDVKQLHPVATDTVEVAAPAGTVGNRQAVNTSFEAILMRVRTGLAGKSKRGRNFLPPPGDADLTNSVLINGPANDFYSGFIDCLGDKFIGAGATENFRLGILSRKTLMANANNYDLAFTPATNLAVEQRVSVLRSRKLGTGS